MKEFEYIITDTLGIHARPAVLLVKKVSEFESDIKIYKANKEADAKKLFRVMGLGVKMEDTVKITIEGTDEELAFSVIREFMKENL